MCMSGDVALVYDDALLSYDFGRHHPLRPVRLKFTYELIRSLGILNGQQVRLEKPLAATVSQVSLFHNEEYIELVKELSKTGKGLLDSGDTPAFKNCFESSLLYVGASLRAADLIMTNKVIRAFNPAGGLHHAHRDRASGFCIFNDPAIVVAFLKHKYGVKRLMYLDIDAHHGDGVMYGFYSDPSLLNIDFHEDGRYLFPGTGFTHETGEGEAKGLKINIPLPPDTGNSGYLRAFREIIPISVRHYKPEIIIMQCGADSHRDDLLGGLAITTQCYDEMVSMVCELSNEICGGRVLLLGGGGYNISSVARCWAVAFARLSSVSLIDELPVEWKARLTREFDGGPMALHDPKDISSLSIKSDASVEDVMASLRSEIPFLEQGGPARS